MADLGGSRGVAMDLEDRLSSPTQRPDGNLFRLGNHCWRCVDMDAESRYIDLCDLCYEDLRS